MIFKSPFAYILRMAAEYIDKYPCMKCLEAIGFQGNTRSINDCVEWFSLLYRFEEHLFEDGKRKSYRTIRNARVLQLLLAAEVAEDQDIGSHIWRFAQTQASNAVNAIMNETFRIQ